MLNFNGNWFVLCVWKDSVIGILEWILFGVLFCCLLILLIFEGGFVDYDVYEMLMWC